MRVMLLVEVLTIGGLPNHVLDQARALAEAGDTVVVAHGGPAPAHLDTQGVPLLSWPAGDAAQALASITAWRPEVLHLHLCSDRALLRGLLALRAQGVPLLRSFHDYTSLCLRRGRRRFPGDRCQRALGLGCLLQGCGLGPPPAGRRWPTLANLPAKLDECAAYRGFDMSLVGSRYMQRTLLNNGFAAERVRLLPYFSRFDQAAQGHTPLAPKPRGVPGHTRPLALMFAGQAVAGKGLLPLLRALAGLRGPWQLLAVTAGPQLDAAKALSHRLGLAARIHFQAWLPPAQVAGLYRQADLLVIPSVWDDPGPLVGLEALSMGTPVLGFPVGGIPDYAIPGQTGFLAHEARVPALTQALQQALQQGAELARLGQQGRAHVAQVHGRQRHVQTLQAIYRDLVAGGPAHPVSTPSAALPAPSAAVPTVVARAAARP